MPLYFQNRHKTKNLFFFFQAEDGIRDLYVTGVQTCALPISSPARRSCPRTWRWPGRRRPRGPGNPRSEERRVGKSVDLGGRRIIKKKNKKNEALSCEERNKAQSIIYTLKLPNNC